MRGYLGMLRGVQGSGTGRLGNLCSWMGKVTSPYGNSVTNTEHKKVEAPAFLEETF